MGAKVMTKPIVKEHNAETGEIVEREMSTKEFAAHNAWLTEQAQREAEATAKAAAREAVLEKLGLTAEEMAALLP